VETELPELLQRDRWSLLPLLPWGGVAALVSGGASESGGNHSVLPGPKLPKKATKGFACSYGRPLCATGLPMLVNGTVRFPL
jgi:hypothetical protein